MKKFSAPLKGFFEQFDQLDDPRDQSTVEFSVGSILRLVVIGLLAGQTNVEAIAQYGLAKKRRLWRPLGMAPAPRSKGGRPTKREVRRRRVPIKPRKRARPKMPHRTTVGRVLALVNVAQLADAFMAWMSELLKNEEMVAAVDGKCAKGSKGEGDNPLMMLNIFAHDIKATLGTWPIPDKSAETSELKKRLAPLFEKYPCLRLLTGDALYATRPMCQAIIDLERDYLVRVKENQPELVAALKSGFAEETTRPADARETGKKGGSQRFASCG